MLRAILVVIFLALPNFSFGQTAPTDNDVSGFRKIQAAAYRDDSDQISSFVAAGENIEATDDFGRTPIIIATHQSASNSFMTLLNEGANINARDNEGFDALTIASWKKDATIIDLAVKNGADVFSTRGPRQDTVIGYAARNGDVSTVSSLIPLGVPLNFTNIDGDTPLQQAVKFGDGGTAYQQIVTLLIEGGAKKGKRDVNGNTPRKNAKLLGFKEIVKIIKSF